MYWAATIPLVLLGLFGSFGITIPQSVRLYQNWKHTQKTTTFSSLILMGAISFYLVFLAYRISMDVALNSVSQFLNTLSGFQEGLVRIVGFFSLFTCIHFVLAPQWIHFFRKWRSTQNPIHLSIALFFSGVTFFLLVFIYLYIFET